MSALYSRGPTDLSHALTLCKMGIEGAPSHRDTTTWQGNFCGVHSFSLMLFFHTEGRKTGV